MSGSASNPERDRAPGFTQQLKATVAISAAALHTRLALFVTELEEERERLKQTAILLLLAISGASLGFLLLNIFLVALFWERGWIAAIGILGLVYFGVAIAALLKLRSAILQRPGLFPATIEELGKDLNQLRGPGRE